MYPHPFSRAVHGYRSLLVAAVGISWWMFARTERSMHWQWLSVYRSRQHRSERVFLLPVRHCAHTTPCMTVCDTHAHTHTCTHAHTHTRMHTCTHACTHAHTHAHTHTHTHNRSSPSFMLSEWFWGGMVAINSAHIIIRFSTHVSVQFIMEVGRSKLRCSAG